MEIRVFSWLSRTKFKQSRARSIYLTMNMIKHLALINKQHCEKENEETKQKHREQNQRSN